MANLRTKAIRDLAIFIAVLLFCLVAPRFIRNTAGDVFDEFSAPIDAVPSQLRDLVGYWDLNTNSKRELIEAGRDLSRLNSSYINLVGENELLRDKIRRYEALLNMPSFEEYHSVVARVVRRDINLWWQQIVIRRGTLDNIQVGDAVISRHGVVGRVVECSMNTSVVELVSSPSFRMAAYFENSLHPVIYTGMPSKAFTAYSGKVADVPTSFYASEKEALLLYTSALAGTFPEGIYIGKVTDLTLDSDAIFKSGAVILPPELYNLTELIVLVPTNRQ